MAKKKSKKQAWRKTFGSMSKGKLEGYKKSK